MSSEEKIVFYAIAIAFVLGFILGKLL